MWKRDEAPRPPAPVVPNAPAPVREIDTPQTRQEPPARSSGREVAHIGKSVVIKGELTASEDLTVEGQVEGQIELRDHILTIGPNGRVNAKVSAKIVIVEGSVHGNIMATERVDIRDAGAVEGDVSAPRVAIADGAHFRGSIDMQRGGGDTKPAAAPPAKPAASTAAVSTAAATPAAGAAGAQPNR